ncbi:quaternary ammonium compound-resistance protein SugE [Litorimonas taeanensis]|uniref:Guanidinium exporter n=1 Tax=Litorimonas taeanensis TaxID=568099 RepID=A0A420WID8_9PROT|nr:multidrug efflux SMR transporter [Litorimonas taeanensis]RKQ70753.1 quaternary ammonium compound-resistance protein SugE [Litorimonas taeanensis]
MAWVYLLLAGLLETVWSTSLKHSADKGSVFWLFVTGIAMIASLLALYAAMRNLPLGVAYPIWTGIGSVSAIVVGVFLFKETINISTVIGVLFLIVGMGLISLKAH